MLGCWDSECQMSDRPWVGLPGAVMSMSPTTQWVALLSFLRGRYLLVVLACLFVFHLCSSPQKAASAASDTPEAVVWNRDVEDRQVHHLLEFPLA